MSQRHGESVYQRGKRGGRAGQWVAVADLGWKGDKRDRREFTGKTKAEALLKRDRFLHQREDGFTLPRGRPPYVSEWLQHWLYNIVRPTVAATTWHSTYRQKLEGYAIPYFARVRLGELTEEDIEAWHVWLARRPSRRGGHLSPGTITVAHGVLGMALKEAAKRGKIPRNPCANVSPPGAPRTEIRPPSSREVHEILRRCETWPNGARWVIALSTGLRQGEALALRWRDVRLESPASVTVRWTRARVAGEWVVKEPKTAKSRRTVPLTARAVAALRQHRAAQAVASLDGLVFTTPRGLPWHGREDREDWHLLLADLGLPRYRVHDCRHATATMLLAAGTDVRVVQEILGHAKASVTQDIYQHVTQEMLGRAVSALDQALGD